MVWFLATLSLPQYWKGEAGGTKEGNCKPLCGLLMAGLALLQLSCEK